MSFYGKVYKFQSSENLDAFLNSLGLPADKLSYFSNFKPDQKIDKLGDAYIYTFSTAIGDKPLSFTSGIEFEDQAREISIKNTFTVAGNHVTHIMKFDSGVTITVKKEFSATKLVEELTNRNWNGAAYITYA